MFGGAGEPIKTPHDNHIKLPLASVIHEFVKFRARVFCTGLADINVFADQIKSSGRAVSPKITDLKLTTLVLGADTSIDSDSQGYVLPDRKRKRLFFAHSAFPTRSTTEDIRI
jgi:hypothetical protein